MRLDDTVLPTTILLPDSTRLNVDLSPEELREACRALRGSVLRQEIYALDGSDASAQPYSASERNYTIEALQPQGPNRYAVFFTHDRETIDFHYERKLFEVSGTAVADPRVTHAFTLAVDSFGNVLQSAAVGYGRRYHDTTLASADQAKQSATLSTCGVTAYTNAVLLDDSYRTPLPVQSISYQLLQVQPTSALPGVTDLFTFAEITGQIQSASDGNHDIEYQNLNPPGLTPGQPYRRLLKCARTYYRPDDMGAAANDVKALLPLGVLQSLALPGCGYTLAFTPDLISQVYQRSATALLPTPPGVFGSIAADGGGYVDLDQNSNWWIPLSRIYFSPSLATPQVEFVQAVSDFFLPRRAEDPFGNIASLDYDPHNLLVVTTRDPLTNTATAVNDYRVLQPALLTDPNGNGAAVSFDVLGMVAGTAVMGKITEKLGDSLTGFLPDLTQQHIDDFFAAPDPHTLAGGLLVSATTRIIYDLNIFQTSQAAYPSDPTQWQPAFAAILARETHVSDLAANQQTNIQIAFSYSDGYGREIQKKAQAEPDPATPTIPRWTASGWTIFNNKGKPVRQYEPFFTASHQFEFGITVGVSSILCYDPLTRVIATIHPNQTYEKVVFDPWQQQSWDVNDTVLQTDPTADPDVGDFFKLLPPTDYSPTWYSQRSSGALGQWEQDAATKTAAHANTPAIAYFDTLGRPFLTVADNAAAGKYRDARRARYRREPTFRDRRAWTYGNALRLRYRWQTHPSGEHGSRRTLDAERRHRQTHSRLGHRGHNFRTAYDALRRHTAAYVQGTPTANSDPRTIAAEILTDQTVYGEGQPSDTALNLRTRIYQHSDSAGLAQNSSLRFQRQSLLTSRQFLQDYKALPNWSGTQPALQTQIFTTSTQYDALNRRTSSTAPDGSIFHDTYNQTSLLAAVNVNLQGAQTSTNFVLISSMTPKATGNRCNTATARRPRTHTIHSRSA